MPSTDTSWINLGELIRRKLGSGMIDIELTDDQVNDAIRLALKEFRMRGDSSAKEGWMFLKLHLDQRIYSMPTYVEDVLDIQRVNEAFFSSFENSQFTNFLYNHLRTGTPFDLLTYHLERAWLEDLGLIAATHISFRFHSALDGSQLGEGPALSSAEADQVPDTRPTGSRLIDTAGGSVNPQGQGVGQGIDTPNKEMEFSNRLRLEGPVIEILKRVRGASETVLVNLMYSRTDAELINDKMTGRWVEKYATAEAKMMLGNAYRKFASIPGPGGGLALPGNDLITEGKEEKEKLEQDLLDFLYGVEPPHMLGPI